MPDRLRSTLYVAKHRTVNRIRDLRAIAAGYCNDCPWRPEPGSGGGYTFWRCALRRGHPGLHRARNYVWADDGRTEYAPVPLHTVMPDQPTDRHGTPSRAQARARRHWDRRRRTELAARATEQDDA